MSRSNAQHVGFLRTPGYPHLQVVALYLLLGSGGLWHLLGLFQEPMRVLAGPLLIGLNVWALLEYQAGLSSRAKRRFLLWSAGIILAGFGLEWVGVSTGAVFGAYRYSGILQPQLVGVPVAIGFAWLGVALISHSVVTSVLPAMLNRASLTVGLSALLMLLFDLAMEPAAIRLDYWIWAEGEPPMQNYLIWFVTGVLIFTSGKLSGVLRSRIDRPVLLHLYFAQLLYFMMVLLKPAG